MLLSLRSLLPLSLSGVFALIGLWWYSARKKGRLAGSDARDDGTAEPSGDKRRGLGSSDAALTRAAALAEPGAAPLGQSEPVECTRREGGAAVRASPDLKASTGAFCTASSEPSKRPDPEGEVGEDSLALCFTEKRPPVGPLENSALSKDIHPGLATAAVGPVSGSGPQEPKGPLTAPSLPWCLEPETQPSLEEMNQVAAGVITDVVSLAVAEVLRDEALLKRTELPPCSSQDPCPAADGPAAENVTAQRDRPPLGGESPTAGGDIGMSSTLPGDGDPDGSRRPETQRSGGLPEPAVAAAADSSTSSTESDDGSSEEDYKARSRPLAELPEGLSQSSRPIRAQPEALRNGHGVEEELTPGGAVTSMASGDSQTSTIQPSPSAQPDGSERLSPTQSTGPQTIWEIEVPKHLVGRLIGKQGRYVSYLKDTSGAKVFISTLPFTQEVQICHIEGTKDQVEAALDLIRMKFKDLELTNCYVPPTMPSLPALPITSWLLLPPRVTVEVQVAQVASGNYLFLQQHTHPTFHALHSLDQQMRLCYAHPGCPTLPAPVEVGVICAAQMPDGAWWRAQVMRFSEETREVEIRYVDYGGYHTVAIDSLRQIRSDFVSLPFQGSEVILDNLACLPGEEDFSAAAKAALEDLTNGLSLLAQVTEFHTSGIPLVQIWRKDGNELVSVNQALVERGVCSWINRP